MAIKMSTIFGRTGKITIATTLILLLTIGILFAVNQSTIAGKPAPPQTWTLRLPSSYSSSRQLFINFFPELTASKFHYYNPNLVGGGSLLSLTINLESVSAKATDLVFSENWHLKASGVDTSIGVPIGIGDIRVARIACKDLTADVNLWPADAEGVFGMLTAKLKGDVVLSVPIVPGSPIPGYYYLGQELAIEFTFVEPIYIVTVTPDSLSIPQGCDNGPTLATVTVTPLEAGITSFVNLGFECNMGGIDGWIEGGGTPPLTSLPLHINVQPWVPNGTYTANVIASDYSTGKQFRSNDITITVTESGYNIRVNGQNPFTTNIQQGGADKFMVTIDPWTPYSSGMPLYWQPTLGDFNGIGIGLPDGIPPPPTYVEMFINVEPWVEPGAYEMNICVNDGNLQKEFTCHVTINVYAPAP